MDAMVVAVTQAEAVPADLPTNVLTAARLAATVAGRGASVVVLPELFLSAYHLAALRASTAADVEADDASVVLDRRLDPLRDTAKDHSIVIVVGAPVRHADGRRACSALVVDRAGGIVAAYDKQQLWAADEQALFAPGRHGTTLVVDGWRLGLGICYDGCFPEHGRAAADDGAHGYLVPSGYVTGSAHRRDLYYAARALDNTMYVAFANSVGGRPPWHLNGGAAIYEPEGRVLGRAPDEGEAVVVAAFDPTVLAKVRAEHPMLTDRRDSLGPRTAIAVE
jgi:predicted amidohydrolase